MKARSPCKLAAAERVPERRRHNAAATDAPEYSEIAMSKLETVVPDELLDRVITTVRRAGHTGRAGDGKIFVSDVSRAINIRDDAEGVDVL